MTQTLVEPNASPTRSTVTPSLRSGAAVMTAATVVVGAANYGMALLMARLLTAGEFSRFASGQGLLLVIGTGSMAALPWAVSHYLADTKGERDPSKALHFGLVGSVFQAVVLGGIAFCIALVLDGPAFALAVLAAVVLISLLSGPIGFFQGQDRIAGIAGARLLETGVRIGSGILLVLLVSRSAVSGLLGFAIGSAVATTWLVWKARDAFPLRRPDRTTALRLTRQATLLGAIQVFLSMLGALDTVYIAAAHFGADATASYQSAAIIGRVPLFVSSAVSIASYTALVSAEDDRAVGRIIRSCLSAYTWFVLPVVAIGLTVPGSLFYSVVPPAYTEASSLLRFTVISGVSVGLINVLTTAHQARGRFRNGIAVLVVGVALQGALLLGLGRVVPITGFAVIGAVLMVAVFAALTVDARAWLRARPTAAVVRVIAVATLSVLLGMARTVPVLWLFLAVVLIALCLIFAHRSTSSPITGRHQRKADR